MSKSSERLNRLFDRLEGKIPHFAARFLAWVRRPAARLIRIPLGILLVLGGIFSFLPVLGIWMLPLGLLLLALDLIFLQGPVNNAVLRGSRTWTRWQRWRRRSKEK
jgi:membrane-bound ClpP family serine protease